MIIKNKYIFIIVILFILYGVVCKDVVREINIKNTDYSNLDNIGKKITELSKVGSIRAVFNDETYYIPQNGQNHFTLSHSLTFYSKNGATFNYQTSYISNFVFHFQTDKNIKIVFENIKFTNFFSSQYKNSNMLIIDPSDDSNNFSVEFKNCTFTDTYNSVVQLNVQCIKNNQSSPQISFNNCKFINLEQIIDSRDFYSTKVFQSYDCFNTHFKECYFENNKYIGDSSYGNVVFENCN
ncbi:hypothetical protein BCR36DRAFT_346255 [Piromyces finnis]|uniref:Right handed beta helix domain-containing protein n=1 Tax=Piromyces finnis TaxID=1754191 RepID=A0A1Y1VIH0_9FUNG|nr:hypothetical protein BCR36DRAFT_346255 [Piromyces finnis]|eukprot:ORX55892.1 hypothetical protein BCR36DRAFT_346255 [Piromyces finnis]